MDPDPVNGLIDDLLVAIEDFVEAIIRLSGHDKHVMTLFCPSFADRGDRKSLRIIELADDQDFHGKYYRTDHKFRIGFCIRVAYPVETRKIDARPPRILNFRSIEPA